MTNSIVFNRTSKIVSSGSFGRLTFSGFAYLSWKGKATYVDGAYSEGKATPNQLPVSRTDQAEIVTRVAGKKIKIINESH